MRSTSKGRYSGSIVSADAARTHLLMLLDRSAATREQIGRCAGVNRTTIGDVVAGRRTTIREDVADAILAVSPEDATRYGTPEARNVDAVTAHVHHLLHFEDVSLPGVGRAGGVSTKVLRKIVNGTHSGEMRGGTGEAILAVTGESAALATEYRDLRPADGIAAACATADLLYGAGTAARLRGEPVPRNGERITIASCVMWRESLLAAGILLPAAIHAYR